MAPGRVLSLPTFADGRGRLTVVEREPFEVKRAFWLHDITETRGRHAHKSCHQLLACMSGEALVRVGAFEVRLLDPSVGVHVPPGNLVEVEAPGAVVLVLCSEHYDPEEYVE